MSELRVQGRFTKMLGRAALILAAMFVTPMVATASEASTLEFSLGIEPSESGFTELAGIDALVADGELQLAVARLQSDSRNEWRTVSVRAEESSSGGKSNQGGFGRWLKKRWYIPVLAAVALGVALDDDDAAGEIDDTD